MQRNGQQIGRNDKLYLKRDAICSILKMDRNMGKKEVQTVNNQYVAVSNAVRDRVLQIRSESPWMEDYEIEAIVCTEFNLNALNVSDIIRLASGGDNPLQSNQYSTIQSDAIGKFGAYEAVNKGASQRRDVATRALYTLTEQKEESQNNAAILSHAKASISANIRRESNRVGFSLLLFIIIEVVICIVLVMFTVGVMGWSVDEVYNFITEPQSMALLHAGMLLLGLAFPFLAYIYIHKLPINEMIPLHRLRKGEFMPLVLMGLALMMVDGCFVNYLTHPGGVRGANYSFDVVSFGNTAPDALLTLFCLGIVPALIETFVFNGVILQVFRRRGGDAFALFASSMLFAIMTTNFAEMPGAFLTSVWLGYMVIFSGSLVPAVVVRLCERLLFFGVTQLGFGLSNAETIGYIDCAISVVLIVAGILATASMLKRFPEFFVLKKSDPCLSLSEKLRITVMRWPTIVLIIYSLVFSLIQIIDLNKILESANAYIFGA